ncbi:hypothetical protein R80B4_00207 [Fibrobacteres bacterium R8-0-B4]
MRFNRFYRLYPLSALISAVLLALFCSRTDVITGAGSTAVTDYNPELTDLDRGFARIALIDKEVGTAFSLPASPDPLFGTFSKNYILIGLSDDNDTLAAHIQYDIAGDTSYIDTSYTKRDSLIDVYIYCRAADSGAPSNTDIPLYLSDPLPGLAPVNRTDGDNADNMLGSFPLSGGELCSLQLREDVADSIFALRRDTDGRHKTFAFSIVGYTDSLIKLDNPYIVVRRLRWLCCPDRDTLLLDTINGSTRYSPFEDSEAAVRRAAEPYSSLLTQRTAVFKVNAGKILDSLSRLGLSGSNSELLNAVITVRVRNSRDDTSALSAKRLAKNEGNFEALILDTYLTKDIDTLSAEGAHLLRYRFKKDIDGIGPIDLATPYNPLDHQNKFKTALRDVIRKYHPGDSAYIYVYLRPTTEYNVIRWCPPVRTDPPNIPSVTVETVFTPHSLRRGNDINK